jgi:hypothetical protein
VNLVQRTFCGLHEADRVLRVALSLAQALDLATQLLADSEAGGVIGGTVDTQAGAKALHRLRGLVARADELAVGVERLDVAVDAKGHRLLLDDGGLWSRQATPCRPSIPSSVRAPPA